MIMHDDYHLTIVSIFRNMNVQTLTNSIFLPVILYTDKISITSYYIILVDEVEYVLTHWITISTVLGKSSFEREVPYPVRRLKTDLKSGYFGENKTDLENVPQSRCFYSYHRTNPAVYLNNKIIKFYTKFHLRYQNPSKYHKIIMKSIGTLTNSNRATKSHSI